MRRALHAAVPGQLCLLQLLDRDATRGGAPILVGAVGANGPVGVDGSGEVGPAGGRAGAGLGEWEQAVLRFAAEHHLTGRYGERVRQALGCSTERYVQALAVLLDRDEALTAAPELVMTLRGLRDRRRRLRERARSRR